MRKIIQQIVLSGSLITLSSMAMANISIEGAYTGTVQSQGYGKASCSVSLQKGAQSHTLSVSICSANAKSCMNAKFQADGAGSALSNTKINQALGSAKIAKGGWVFTSKGYANGGEETLVGRLNSSAKLEQVMYTTGAWLYPVYIVCGNLDKN